MKKLLLAFLLLPILAAAQTVGIKVATPFIKNNPVDNTITGYADLLNGGYHIVPTVAGRDSLTAYYTATLKPGMLTFVQSDSTYYRLQADNTWLAVAPGNIKATYVPYKDAIDNITLGNHFINTSDGTNYTQVGVGALSILTTAGSIGISKAGTPIQGTAIEPGDIVIRNANDLSNGESYLIFRRNDIGNKTVDGNSYAYTYPLRTGTFALSGSVVSRDSIMYSSGAKDQHIDGFKTFDYALAAQSLRMFGGVTPGAGEASIARLYIGSTISDRYRNVDYYTGSIRDWSHGESPGKQFSLRRYDATGTLIDSIYSVDKATGDFTFFDRVLLSSSTPTLSTQAVNKGYVDGQISNATVNKYSLTATGSEGTGITVSAIVNMYVDAVLRNGVEYNIVSVAPVGSNVRVNSTTGAVTFQDALSANENITIRYRAVTGSSSVTVDAVTVTVNTYADIAAVAVGTGIYKTINVRADENFSGYPTQYLYYNGSIIRTVVQPIN